MFTTTLDNGLRVVVQRREVTLVAIYLWIEAGSSDELPGEFGAAHFLEHMLFKGTARRGVGASPAAIEALGGDLNAYTTADVTVIHATVEAEGWEAALDVIADMARFATFDPDELERERAVVLEEIRGYASDPQEVLGDAIQAANYPDHPYARPIVASAAEVAALPREALLNFWRRSWGPNRAILSVAGGVDPDRVVALTQALLGDWPAAQPRAPLAPPHETVGPRLIVPVAPDKGSRLVELSWRGPALTDEEAAAAEILMLTLADGPSGEVPERLLGDEDPAIADPWGSVEQMRLAGAVSLGFLPRRGRTEEAIARTLEELAQAVLEGLDEDSVSRTRAGMLGDEVFRRETVDGLASGAAHHLSYFGDPSHHERWLATVARTTAEDVNRLARRLLRPERLTLGVVDRDVTPASLDAALNRGVRFQPSDPWRPIDVRLANGVRLIVMPDPTEVVGMTAMMPGGMLAVAPRRAGVAAAWSHMCTAGADGMSAGRFSAAMDRTGGEAWGAATRGALQLQMQVPAEAGLEAFSLCLMAISRPEWDELSWDQAQEELLHDAESASDYPAVLAEEALWSALWPDHPWRLPYGGTPGTVRALTRDHLAEYYAEHLAGENLVIAIVGRVPSPRVLALAEDWLADVPARLRGLRPSKSPEPQRSRTIVRTSTSDQTHVSVGVRGLSSVDPQRAAAEVLASVLGAQGGRLFLELRERRGLAYSVWAEETVALPGGVFEVGLACDPTRTDEAIGALHAQLDAIVRTPPSLEEVTRAARTLRGARAAALQRATARAGRLASAACAGKRLNPDPSPAAWAAVTPQEVAEVAGRILGKPRVTVRVDPAGG